MKVGYEGFWIDLPVKESMSKIRAFCKDALKNLDEKKVKQIKIGLVLQSNGFVYQRGIIKISREELSHIEMPVYSFNRPFLQDIFGDKLLYATEEKVVDEPEDLECDIYLYI